MSPQHSAGEQIRRWVVEVLSQAQTDKSPLFATVSLAVDVANDIVDPFDGRVASHSQRLGQLRSGLRRGRYRMS